MNANDKLVSIEKRGAVATATLNRPAPMNALNVELALELGGAFKQLKADASVRAVVLAGAGGRAFCAGGDVRDMNETAKATGEGSRAYLSRLIVPLHESLRAIAAVGKPVVAAVDGVAAGAGVSLALACHFRVVSSATKFVGAYMNIALTPDGGAPWTLVRLVGTQRARDFYALGEIWDAETLKNIGLANRIAAPGAVLEEALSMAETLATKPAAAMASTLELIESSAVADFSTHLDLQQDAILAMSETADHREGLEAFFGKRKPNFNAGG